VSSTKPGSSAWSEVIAAAPQLAAFVADRLNSSPAYLATIKVTGAPRLHPVTPIVTDRGLYVFMEPNSPKGTDLGERAWFALHSGVHDSAGTGGEASVSGTGHQVKDPALRSLVVAACPYEPADRYLLFELALRPPHLSSTITSPRILSGASASTTVIVHPWPSTGPFIAADLAVERSARSLVYGISQS
jgi:hypothetical protein